MISFLALYHGDSATDAKMIAVSSDRALVAEFAQRLLRQQSPLGERARDPVLASMERGRRQALRLIAREGEDEDAG